MRCEKNFIFNEPIFCHPAPLLFHHTATRTSSRTPWRPAMYNTDLDKKLDQLSLEPEPAVPPYAAPQKSLLSSSLANERYHHHYQHQHQAGAFFSLDDESSSTTGPTARAIDIQRHYTDDHPEPVLLATSVGKDQDGRMIPSSSTISLLSLSIEDPSPAATYKGPQPQAFLDRKNSYNNIATRSSLTHLSQQRLQPYTKYTSPLPGPQPAPTFGSSPQTTASAEHNHSTAQSIPIGAGVIVPDSPSLDPTSLGGSPSRFWLTAQTPPRTVATSFRGPGRATSTQGPQKAHPMYIPIHVPPTINNYTTLVTLSSSLQGCGGDLPVLNPVQTPSEDPPMTPLFLNRNPGDSYFGDYGDGHMVDAVLEENEDERSDQEMDVPQ